MQSSHTWTKYILAHLLTYTRRWSVNGSHEKLMKPAELHSANIKKCWFFRNRVGGLEGNFGSRIQEEISRTIDAVGICFRLLQKLIERDSREERFPNHSAKLPFLQKKVFPKTLGKWGVEVDLAEETCFWSSPISVILQENYSFWSWH